MELKCILLLLSVISMISIAFTHRARNDYVRTSCGCDEYESSSDSSLDISSENSTYYYYTQRRRGWRGGEVGDSCNKDEDCRLNLACDNHECVDPCSPNLCRYQPCRVRRHKRYCGYPCSRNRDCKGFEMCDMRILQCRAVCNPSPCGLNEVCHGRNHKAHCRCARHYNRNYWGVCSPCRQYARYDGTRCWCERGKMPRCKKP